MIVQLFMPKTYVALATDSDKVIMLGTCTDDGNKRFVVFGVRVDAHGR